MNNTINLPASVFVTGFALLLFLSVGCQPKLSQYKNTDMPVDKQATKETSALYLNLKTHAKQTTLFGHQDDLAYGVHWQNEPGRSDVKESAGSYPAVYGWEVGDIGNETAVINLDTVKFDNMRNWIKEGYQRGGVITISWHMDNPVSDGSAWDTTEAVSHILPGGSHHQKYLVKLDRFAAFIKTLSVRSGFLGFGKEPIPLIFRPFHEMTGGWFWWGEGHRTDQEFRELWQFTFTYLKDQQKLHNLLYAYSPGSPAGQKDKSEFWEPYPGDKYVDIIGVDDYHTLQRESEGDENEGKDGTQMVGEMLSWLVNEADKRDKIPAFTETGLEGVSQPTWFTDKLLKAITYNQKASEIAYVMVWRNAMDKRKPGHFYAPYREHSSATDFKHFYRSPDIMFEDTLPDLYQLPDLN